MINNVKIEICIGNIDDALTASKYPIDRIELNSALELGGLTPTVETLKYLKQNIESKICCMVRPRGGNFIYTELEFKTMLKDAKLLLDNGADGIVFGFTKDNEVDYERTSEMVELIHSYNKEAIFHKAFDELDDLDKGASILKELKIDRILTSGKAVYPDIIKGCEEISKLNKKYPEIQFLPGGGVRVNNIKDVIKTAKTGQVHMTSKRTNEGNYVELEESQLIQLLDQIKSL